MKQEQVLEKGRTGIKDWVLCRVISFAGRMLFHLSFLQYLCQSSFGTKSLLNWGDLIILANKTYNACCCCRISSCFCRLSSSSVWFLSLSIIFLPVSMTWVSSPKGIHVMVKRWLLSICVECVLLFSLSLSYSRWRSRCNAPLSSLLLEVDSLTDWETWGSPCVWRWSPRLARI